MKRVSVILPVYSAGEKILKTISSVHEFSLRNLDYDFIFVNDGSKDQTERIISYQIAKLQNKRIKMISYKVNHGKGFAVKTGVQNAEGDLVCFTDADLAYSLENLKSLVRMLEKYDLVIGSRAFAKNGERIGPTRKVLGQGFNLLSRFFMGLKFKDMQAGLKGFRSHVAKKLFIKQKIPGFAFDVEILYLAKKYGYTVGQVPALISNPETYKDSTVNLVQDTLKMFLNLLEVRFSRYGKNNFAKF